MEILKTIENKEAKKYLLAAIERDSVITNILLHEVKGRENLLLYFEDGSGISIYDTAQECCELRYMRTDDNLKDFVGSKLKDVILKDYKQLKDDEYGDVHEIVFLEIVTDKGSFVMSNHNEHNGYYGGFDIDCEPLTVELLALGKDMK